MSQVLIVEDEWLVAANMADAIRDQGCSVVGPFPSVAPALHAIQAGEVDCAVLDYRLWGGETSRPIMDALETRAIPYIIVSASHHVEASAPSVDRLAKPVSDQALLAAVRSMTRREPP